jgi:hypothetical protein
MTNQISKNHIIVPALIAVIATWRVLTYFIEHGGLYGLTPICAMALFGAAYLRGALLPFLIPIGALFLSDVVLCFTVYEPFRRGLLYEGWQWVYLSFVLIIIAGRLIMRKANIRTAATSILVSSLIHWLVATLSECAQIGSSSGFVELYLERLIPAASYELRVLGGTLLYGALLFGGYHLIRNKAQFSHDSKLKNV